MRLASSIPIDPSKGFAFQGRIAEDFKLSTGTWVRVGPLRARLLAELGDLVHDVAIAGPDRDFVTALLFPNLATLPRRSAVPARASFRRRQLVADSRGDLAGSPRCSKVSRRRAPASSTSIARAMVMEQPPSIDAHETTEKGSINQKAVLANRAALVDELYANRPRI